jgi:hypothetical protein
LKQNDRTAFTFQSRTFLALYHQTSDIPDTFFLIARRCHSPQIMPINKQG